MRATLQCYEYAIIDKYRSEGLHWGPNFTIQFVFWSTQEMIIFTTEGKFDKISQAINPEKTMTSISHFHFLTMNLSRFLLHKLEQSQMYLLTGITYQKWLKM